MSCKAFSITKTFFQSNDFNLSISGDRERSFLFRSWLEVTSFFIGFTQKFLVQIMVSTVGHWIKLSYQVLLLNYLLNNRNFYHRDVYIRFYFYLPKSNPMMDSCYVAIRKTFIIKIYDGVFIKSFLIATSNCFDLVNNI